MSRHDLVLAAIPAAFLVALLASQLFPVQTETTLAAASLVGALAVGDGLFRNPPGRPRSA